MATNVEALRVLLDAGADPAATDACGRTPLHFAAGSPWPTAVPAVELLLARGADARAPSTAARQYKHRKFAVGRAAVVVARGCKNHAVAALLDAAAASRPRGVSGR